MNLSESSGMPITVGGSSLMLCVAFDSLAEAEQFFRSQGHQVELVTSIFASGRVSCVLEVFACAAHRFQPELGFCGAKQLVTLRDYHDVVVALSAAWSTVLSPAGGDSVNASLRFDLLRLADAEEHFARRGELKRGALRESLRGDLSLAVVRDIFPCALWSTLPELSFAQAQSLMDKQSILSVVKGLPAAWAAASNDVRQQFAGRLLEKRSWSRVAHV